MDVLFVSGLTGRVTTLHLRVWRMMIIGSKTKTKACQHRVVHMKSIAFIVRK